MGTQPPVTILWNSPSTLISVFIILLLPYLLAGFVIAVYSRRYDLSELFSSPSSLPLVSIVIPTYNEQDSIAKKLSNIQSLIYPEDRLEILVVDCSTDATPNIVREASARDKRIKLISEPERTGLAAALNVGYGQASGKIVVKSDADALVFTPDAIKRAARLLENPKVGGVCGIYSGVRRIEGTFRNMEIVQQMAETMIDSIIVAHGSFAAFKKEAMGVLDPTSMADDTEMFMKIRRKGYRTILDNGIKTSEPYPSTIRWRIDQKSRRAGGIVRVLLGNVDILLGRGGARFSYLVYPLDLLTIVLLPWIMIAECVLALATAVALFGFVAAPCFLVLILLAGGCYAFNRPRVIAGLVDIWLSCTLGQVSLIAGQREFMWAKSHREVTVASPSSEHSP